MTKVSIANTNPTRSGTGASTVLATMLPSRGSFVRGDALQGDREAGLDSGRHTDGGRDIEARPGILGVARASLRRMFQIESPTERDRAVRELRDRAKRPDAPSRAHAGRPGRPSTALESNVGRNTASRRRPTRFMVADARENGTGLHTRWAPESSAPRGDGARAELATGQSQVAMRKLAGIGVGLVRGTVAHAVAGSVRRRSLFRVACLAVACAIGPLGGASAQSDSTASTVSNGHRPELTATPGQRTVTEAGGIENAIPGTPTAYGDFDYSDDDVDDAVFMASLDDIGSDGKGGVIEGRVSTMPVEVYLPGSPTGTKIQGKYGTLKLYSRGYWHYVLDNSKPATQALDKDENGTEFFYFRIDDGRNVASRRHSQVELVEISVEGANDLPVLTSSKTGGRVYEASETEIANAGPGTAVTATVTGTLDNSDPEGEGVFEVSTDRNFPTNNTIRVTANDTEIAARYGTLSVSLDGSWTYEVETSNPRFATLAVGHTWSDAFYVRIDSDASDVEAEDRYSNRISLGFSIWGTNDTPQVVSRVSFGGATIATGATPWTRVVPENLFEDVDRDNTPGGPYNSFNAMPLEISVRTNPVVPWIGYNAAHRIISAEPPAGAESGTPSIEVIVTATDRHGAHVDTSFTLGLETLRPPSAHAPVLSHAPAVEGESAPTDPRSASVTERGGVGNGDAGVSTTGGGFSHGDPDQADADAGFVASLDTGAGNGGVIEGRAKGTTVFVASTDGGSPIKGIFGTMRLSTDGSWTYTLDDSRDATQALGATESGVDSFEFRIDDGQRNGANRYSEYKTVNVTVTGADDLPGPKGSLYSYEYRTEAGGSGNAEPGRARVAGTFRAMFDPDGGADGVVEARNESGTYEPVPSGGLRMPGIYGVLVLAADGSWTYELDNDDADTERLRKSQLEFDFFHRRVKIDGTSLGGADRYSNWQRLGVGVYGSNDAPRVEADMGLDDALITIGGAPWTRVLPAGLFVDVDSDNASGGEVATLSAPALEVEVSESPSWVTYDSGTRTITATPPVGSTGDHEIVLTATDQHGESVDETFVLQVLTPKAESDSPNSDNSAPVLSLAQSPGRVYESGGVGNGTNAGEPTTSGAFSNDDPDESDTEFWAAILEDNDRGGVIEGRFDSVTMAEFKAGSFGGTLIVGEYGNLTLFADGTWTYALDDDRDATQGLAQDATATDSFKFRIDDGAHIVDGTRYTREEFTVEIDITGADDVPVLLQPVAHGALIEDGGQDDGTASGQLDLAAGDGDDDGVVIQGSTKETYGYISANAGATATIEGNYGDLVLSSDRSWNYTPNPGGLDWLASGENTIIENFYFRIDYENVPAAGTSRYSNSVRLEIKAAGANDAPRVADSMSFENARVAIGGSPWSRVVPDDFFEDLDRDNVPGGTKKFWSALPLTITVDAVSTLPSLPKPSWVTYDALTRTITAAPRTGHATQGAYTVTVTATDLHGESVSRSFALQAVATVDNANPPELTKKATPVPVPVYEAGGYGNKSRGESEPSTTEGAFAHGDKDSRDQVEFYERITHEDNRGGVIEGRAEDVTSVFVPGSTEGTAIKGVYGTMRLEWDGSWEYELEDTWDATENLGAGDSVTDSFFFRIDDGGQVAENRYSNVERVDITVNGADDWAELPARLGLSTVNAFSRVTTTGTVVTLDPDGGSSGSVEARHQSLTTYTQVTSDGVVINGYYGRLTLKANGEYSYSINLESPVVESWPAGTGGSDYYYFRVDERVVSKQFYIYGKNDSPRVVEATEFGDGAVSTGNSWSREVPENLFEDVDRDNIPGGNNNNTNAERLAISVSSSPSVSWITYNTNASTGVTTISAIPPAGSEDVYVVTVTATDRHGASVDKVIDLVVTSLATNSRAPVLALTGSPGPVTEDSATTTTVGGFDYSDLDPNDKRLWESLDPRDDRGGIIEGRSTQQPGGWVSGTSTGRAINGRYGTLTLESNGDWTYALKSSWLATQELRGVDSEVDEFEFRVDDGEHVLENRYSSIVPVNITVNGADDLPVVGADSLGGGGGFTEDDTSTSVDVLGNDTLYGLHSGLSVTGYGVGVDTANAATFAPGSLATGLYGTLAITALGEATYTRKEDLQRLGVGTNGVSETEVDRFVYTAADIHGFSSVGAITVTISGANDAPVATAIPDSLVTAGQSEGWRHAILKANVFSDVDSGDDVLGAGFTYSSQLADGTALPGWLQFGPDATGAELAYSVVEGQSPSQGESELEVALVATDDSGDSVSAEWTLTINWPPAADNDEIMLGEDDAGLVEVNVLSDDDDGGGKADLRVTGYGAGTDSANAAAAMPETAVQGTHGSLTITEMGQASYTLTSTSSLQYLGVDGNDVAETVPDSFVYTVADTQGGTAVGTITVTISGANDAPTATTDIPDAVLTVGAHSAWTREITKADHFSDVDNGDDVLGAGFSYSSRQADGSALPGWLNFEPGGTGTELVYSVVQGQSPSAGDDEIEIEIQATDDGNESVVAAWTLRVNRAPSADDDAIGLGEDDDESAPMSILAHDTDDRGNADLRVTGYGVGTNLANAASVAPGSAADGTHGSLTITALGEATYTRTADLESLGVDANGVATTATDSFVYTVSDMDGATDIGTITVTITGANDAPKTRTFEMGGQGKLTEDQQNQTVSGNVFDHVTDPEGDTLRITGYGAGTNANAALPNVVAGGDYGELVISAQGLATYTLTGNPNHLGDGQTHSDSFSYTVTDDRGASSTGLVSVTITGVNDAPSAIVGPKYVAASSDEINLEENVLTNATDPEGDNVSVLRVRKVINRFAAEDAEWFPAGHTFSWTFGSIQIREDGTIAYTPNLKALQLKRLDPVVQTFDFQFEVWDGTTVAAEPVDATFKVYGDNVLPTVVGQIGGQDQTIEVTALYNSTTKAAEWDFTIPDGVFSDPDNDTLTYRLADAITELALPSWIISDQVNGRFSGEISGQLSQTNFTQGSELSYQVEVWANDGAIGASDDKSRDSETSVTFTLKFMPAKLNVTDVRQDGAELVLDATRSGSQFEVSVDAIVTVPSSRGADLYSGAVFNGLSANIPFRFEPSGSATIEGKATLNAKVIGISQEHSIAVSTGPGYTLSPASVGSKKVNVVDPLPAFTINSVPPAGNSDDFSFRVTRIGRNSNNVVSVNATIVAKPAGIVEDDISVPLPVSVPVGTLASGLRELTHRPGSAGGQVTATIFPVADSYNVAGSSQDLLGDDTSVKVLVFLNGAPVARDDTLEVAVNRSEKKVNLILANPDANDSCHGFGGVADTDPDNTSDPSADLVVTRFWKGAVGFESSSESNRALVTDDDPKVVGDYGTLHVEASGCATYTLKDTTVLASGVKSLTETFNYEITDDPAQGTARTARGTLTVSVVPPRSTMVLSDTSDSTIHRNTVTEAGRVNGTEVGKSEGIASGRVVVSDETDEPSRSAGENYANGFDPKRFVAGAALAAGPFVKSKKGNTSTILGTSFEGTTEGGMTTSGVTVEGMYGVLLLRWDGNWEYYLYDDRADSKNEAQKLTDGQVETDSFYVRAETTTNKSSDPIEITITVNGANDDPVASDNESGLGKNDTEPLSFNVLDDDFDADTGGKDGLLVVGFSWNDTSSTSRDLTLGVEHDTKYGRAQLDGNGLFTYTLGGPNAQAVGFYGLEKFGYTIRDSSGAEDSAEISIVILPALLYFGAPSLTSHKRWMSSGPGDGEFQHVGDANSLIVSEDDVSGSVNVLSLDGQNGKGGAADGPSRVVRFSTGADLDRENAVESSGPGFVTGEWGTLRIDPDGTATYTLLPVAQRLREQDGIDSFAYEVAFDGGGDSVRGAVPRQTKTETLSVSVLAQDDGLVVAEVLEDKRVVLEDGRSDFELVIPEDAFVDPDGSDGSGNIEFGAAILENEARIPMSASSNSSVLAPWLRFDEKTRTLRGEVPAPIRNSEESVRVAVVISARAVSRAEVGLGAASDSGFEYDASFVFELVIDWHRSDESVRTANPVGVMQASELSWNVVDGVIRGLPGSGFTEESGLGAVMGSSVATTADVAPLLHYLHADWNRERSWGQEGARNHKPHLVASMTRTEFGVSLSDDQISFGHVLEEKPLDSAGPGSASRPGALGRNRQVGGRSSSKSAPVRIWANGRESGFQPLGSAADAGSLKTFETGFAVALNDGVSVGTTLSRTSATLGAEAAPLIAESGAQLGWSRLETTQVTASPFVSVSRERARHWGAVGLGQGELAVSRGAVEADTGPVLSEASLRIVAFGTEYAVETGSVLEARGRMEVLTASMRVGDAVDPVALSVHGGPGRETAELQGARGSFEMGMPIGLGEGTIRPTASLAYRVESGQASVIGADGATIGVASLSAQAREASTGVVWNGSDATASVNVLTAMGGGGRSSISSAWRTGFSMDAEYDRNGDRMGTIVSLRAASGTDSGSRMDPFAPSMVDVSSTLSEGVEGTRVSARAAYGLELGQESRAEVYIESGESGATLGIKRRNGQSTTGVSLDGIAGSRVGADQQRQMSLEVGLRF